MKTKSISKIHQIIQLERRRIRKDMPLAGVGARHRKEIGRIIVEIYASILLLCWTD